ncbi:hypothetical protein HY251_15655 [bacterium]|nr:hypothetical protein [bacterium]
MLTRFFLSLSALLVAAVAVANDAPAHPLETARAGHWVFNRSTTLTGGVTKTAYSCSWVEKVADRKVFLKTQEVDAKGAKGITRPLGSVVNLDEKSPLDENAGAAIGEEEIIVKDKTLMCRKVTTIKHDALMGKVTQTVWTSRDVPLYGVVRRETVDKTGDVVAKFELIDWGLTGGGEKPLEGDAKEPGGKKD